jgi:hypothetical protein
VTRIVRTSADTILVLVGILFASLWRDRKDARWEWDGDRLGFYGGGREQFCWFEELCAGRPKCVVFVFVFLFLFLFSTEARTEHSR